ncbi:GntR family transcriptional regulator [Achromobacter aloeverae]|uniref:GntR family transcriptional regulator n=1 Tax=Achromobacter aloeverae TaxID=1750518 RepID=A0A4Q1HSB2_9BURK|nr:GntR family transcriptional regulator [Achromobacter aloeverae]RXN92855.1 GntR family transcriptional regulator [Achromobacter aloeverae]
MSAHTSIVAQLIDLMRLERMPAGTHLAAQKLADRLRVSRSPINAALQGLHDAGIVVREANRGYFLARDGSSLDADDKLIEQLAGEPDVVTRTYFSVAEDLLSGALPMECTEVQLRTRYGLTTAQTQALLARIANEGWVSRRPGYGWEFSSMLTTADSLLQSYRLRMALEPAALLEPGYRLAPAVIERCRQAEWHLLEGGMETDTADQLHNRGVSFHESLVEASGNPFFIDTIKRVNRVRRLLSYRSMRDRVRYRQHCEQHLEVLALLEQGLNEQASNALRAHLVSTLKNLGDIRNLLTSRTTTHGSE